MDFEEEEMRLAKDDGESPDWHLTLVLEAKKKYEANPKDVVKWEDIKKRWEEEANSRDL